MSERINLLMNEQTNSVNESDQNE